jgi:hypothetical protein
MIGPSSASNKVIAVIRRFTAELNDPALFKTRRNFLNSWAKKLADQFIPSDSFSKNEHYKQTI